MFRGFKSVPGSSVSLNLFFEMSQDVFKGKVHRVEGICKKLQLFLEETDFNTTGRHESPSSHPTDNHLTKL